MSPLMLELIYAGIALLAALVCVALLHLVALPVARRLVSRSRTDLDDVLLRMLVLPVDCGILLTGLYLGLGQLTAVDPHMAWVDRLFTVLGTVVGFWAVGRLLNGLMARRERLAEADGEGRAAGTTGIVRKLANLVLIVILLVLVLDQLDYEITPLITSLGIAGVAVALALQDTLGNLFAGFYILFDRPLSVGNYIKLESGEEGFVTEIGWRNTKIRPWGLNAVIIPNAKLAQSTITNHHLPEERQRVYVSCGVSYESDLEHVERVAIEVGKEVMARVEGTDDEWEPVVRFKEFGDSNINFLLVLCIIEFGQQYVLGHECIKALHKRFNEEGIEISWPVRKLVQAGQFEVQGPAA